MPRYEITYEVVVRTDAPNSEYARDAIFSLLEVDNFHNVEFKRILVHEDDEE